MSAKINKEETNKNVDEKEIEESKKVEESKDKVGESKKVEEKVEEEKVEEKPAEEEKQVEESKVEEENKKKESSFLTSTIKKTDEVALGSEDIELKGLQEKFIESNLKDEVLFKSKCQLLIFNKEKKKFEERGSGDIMINKEKDSEMVKVVMIRESLMRFGCNHYINPRFKLIKNDNVSNGWVWATTEDTVDDEVNKKKFYLVKFSEDEDTKKFYDEYEKGRATNKEILER